MLAQDEIIRLLAPPRMPDEAVKEFMAIGVLEQQKRLLAELLDKNKLYVHLSEMDDARFQVSKEEKQLNRKFYGDA